MDYEQLRNIPKDGKAASHASAREHAFREETRRARAFLLREQCKTQR